MSIPALRRNPSFAVFLEQWFRSRPQISKCSASSTTHTLLVFYSADLHLDRLVAWAKQASQEWTAGASVQAIPQRLSNETTVPWHHLDVESVLRKLNVEMGRGLRKSLITGRRKRYGRNILSETKSRTPLEMFIAQLKTLPVALLTGSAALSLMTGGAAEAAVILAVVFANAYIGFGTERLAEITLSLLAKMGPSHIVVIRNGKPKPLLAEELVPGDLIVLVPGLSVPADARIISAEGLSVDESALTGESMPVRKVTGRLKRHVPLAERVNMIYRGTVVTGGNAVAVVTATGDQTEIGKIQAMVTELKPSETPLQRQMDHLSTQLVSASGLLGGAVFVVGLMRGYGVIPMLQTSVTLAIAAVPEGLPTVATTTLAQTALRMKRKKVLVRNLHAVEALGGTEVICLDKTGTLTSNRMTVVTICLSEDRIDWIDGKLFNTDKTFDPGNGDFQQLMRVACLCNETEIVNEATKEPILKGSPTESALIQLALSAGVDINSLRAHFPLIKTEYRTESRSFMTTAHRCGNGRIYVAVKGNPAEVLALSRYALVNNQKRRLTDADRQRWLRENDRLGENALRVLGFAFTEKFSDDISPNELTWVGMIGMADLPRKGIEQFIKTFHRAGIKTTMITGDQRATAHAVAKQLSIQGKENLRLFDWAAEEKQPASALFDEALTKAHVFARVSPAEKVQIVRRLRDSGRVVAMAGDGINDAPALKAANVGIAMGERGTEVAREVADAVLMDDDLRSLITAVELGRSTRDAIKKAVMYLLTTNLSESLIVFGSVAAGTGHPLNPLQLLWINLVSDVFPALALALEPPEQDVLNRPPRDPNEPLITSHDFVRIARESAVMTTGTLVAYTLGIRRYGHGPRAQTMAFTSLAASQLLHTLSCRSETQTLFKTNHLKPNHYIRLSLVIGFGLQAISLWIPKTRQMLKVAPLSPSDLIVCAASSLGTYFTNEWIRYMRLHSGESSCESRKNKTMAPEPGLTGAAVT